jgi:hypothetical protein
MSRRKIWEKNRVSIAALTLLAAGACAGPRKVAALDAKRTQPAAVDPGPARVDDPTISSTAARLAAEVPPPATGSVDTGLQLQFPPMDQNQIDNNLPNVRKQVRAAYPNSTEAQRDKMVKQAEDAMRRGGGVLLVPQ